LISDDHAGLRKAIPEVFPEAKWQPGDDHFLRHALDHLPRKKDDDVLTELRWIYERRNVKEARRDLATWPEGEAASVGLPAE
jgi:putative transposase